MFDVYNSAREALDMLLLQMEGSKPIKAVTYFNTVSLLFAASTLIFSHGLEHPWWQEGESKAKSLLNTQDGDISRSVVLLSVFHQFYPRCRNRVVVCMMLMCTRVTQKIRAKSLV